MSFHVEKEQIHLYFVNKYHTNCTLFILVFTYILYMTQHNNYKEKNNHIIDEIAQTKNLAENTIKNHANTLNQYSVFHQMSMQELLDEADEEEEKQIRMKRRKIKNRILSFRQHLLKEGKTPLTINTLISIIQATYRFYEIETPRIPHIRNTTHETIDDIPSREHIRKALESTNNIGLQALILFMSSSGTSRNEALSITIQDFIDATREYHNEISIENVMDVLEQQEVVVPTFQLYRKKTHYPYITFCSPEATQKILMYLRHRTNKYSWQPGIKTISKISLAHEDKLFHFAIRTVNKNFERLNDKLGWGYKRNNRRFFHPHALRKFFATELLKSDMDAMTIDFLSGRRISSTHEAYFKADPARLKQKYMNFMNNLMIREEITYHDVTSNELQELEYYREKEKANDEKIRRLEEMINRYISLSE